MLVPSTYKAVATYSDRAYYSAATGYVTTASYIGTVNCEEISSITYTVTYVGEAVQPQIEESEEVPVREINEICTKALTWIRYGFSHLLSLFRRHGRLCCIRHHD